MKKEEVRRLVGELMTYSERTLMAAGTDRYNYCLGKRKNAENSLVAALTTESEQPAPRTHGDLQELADDLALQWVQDYSCVSTDGPGYRALVNAFMQMARKTQPEPPAPKPVVLTKDTLRICLAKIALRELGDESARCAVEDSHEQMRELLQGVSDWYHNMLRPGAEYYMPEKLWERIIMVTKEDGK